jgi:hypothetical protein
MVGPDLFVFPKTLIVKHLKSESPTERSVRLAGSEVIMVKRMLFWFIVGCALWLGFTQPDRLAIETDRSIRVWGLELRLQFLLEAVEVTVPETTILPSDTLSVEIATVSEESR